MTLLIRYEPSMNKAPQWYEPIPYGCKFLKRCVLGLALNSVKSLIII